MSYNLTPNQRDAIKWLVDQVNNGNLDEEFYLLWGMDDSLIMGLRGEEKTPQDLITPNIINALDSEGMLGVIPQVENLFRCNITFRAYEAVEHNFKTPSNGIMPQVSIGAIIQTMSGGNVQAMGIVQNAEISQVVNDPELLRSQVEALTENLLNEVKPELKLDELAEYTKAIQEFRDQLISQKPEPSKIRNLIKTIGLLGDIEGTISLVTRVWVYLHPLLLIASAQLH